jgi:hypothetical protein
MIRHDGKLLRVVAPSGVPAYRTLVASGLLDELLEKQLLVTHEEVDPSEAGVAADHVVLAPEVIPFVSYPYEWSFSQLKDAALLTLEMNVIALEHGMVLRDASAYNIQFVGCRPIMIDTLSFGEYEEGEPWIAYKQFCEHFLAPLALMNAAGLEAGRLSRSTLDGVPLPLASRLLPRGTKLKPSLASHVHAHAWAQTGLADDGKGTAEKPARRVSKRSLLALTDSLRRAVEKLEPAEGPSVWAEYYEDTNYSEAAAGSKESFVETAAAELGPSMVWDLGANTGRFSALCAEHCPYIVAMDVDPACVERLYVAGRDAGDRSVLPLVMDLMNASPSLGWAFAERDSVVERGTPDLVLALALIHHLVIAGNVPLPMFVEFMAGLAPWAVIEFVPKEDSQVERLLRSREDIFPDYTQAGFEAALEGRYTIERKEPVESSERTMYLLRSALFDPQE